MTNSLSCRRRRRSAPTCCPARPTSRDRGQRVDTERGPVDPVGRDRHLDVDGLARCGEVLGGEAVVDAVPVQDARVREVAGTGPGAQAAAARRRRRRGDGDARQSRRRRGPTASGGTVRRHVLPVGSDRRVRLTRHGIARRRYRPGRRRARGNWYGGVSGMPAVSFRAAVTASRRPAQPRRTEGTHHDRGSASPSSTPDSSS